MGELAKLPNIGKVLEEQLNQAGITTYEELKDCLLYTSPSPRD